MVIPTTDPAATQAIQEQWEAAQKQFDAMNEIYERVRTRQITREQAEEEAKALGVGPLAKTPDPSKFEPMLEEFWTLPMAVAWIIFQDAAAPAPVDAVRWAWDAYREGVSYFRFDERTGDILRDQNPATIDDVDMYRLLATPRPSFNGAAATALMWRALKSGEVHGWGIESASGKQVLISAAQWLVLKSYNRDNLPMAVRGGGFEYLDVRVPRVEVLRFFKPVAETQGARTNAKRSARALLRRIIQENLDNPIAPKAQLLAALRGLYPALSKNDFERVFREETAGEERQAWRVGGGQSAEVKKANKVKLAAYLREGARPVSVAL